LRGHTSAVRALAFDPRGATLASAGLDRTIRTWDASTGRLVGTLSGDAQSGVDPAVRPAGPCPRSVGSPGTAGGSGAASARPRATLRGHAMGARGLAFSPDSKTLVLVGWHEADIQLWDVGSGRERARWRGHAGATIAATFAPDGRTLAT